MLPDCGMHRIVSPDRIAGFWIPIRALHLRTVRKESTLTRLSRAKQYITQVLGTNGSRWTLLFSKGPCGYMGFIRGCRGVAKMKEKLPKDKPHK